jgi:hypothetical protein
MYVQGLVFGLAFSAAWSIADYVLLIASPAWTIPIFIVRIVLGLTVAFLAARLLDRRIWRTRSSCVRWWGHMAVPFAFLAVGLPVVATSLLAGFVGNTVVYWTVATYLLACVVAVEIGLQTLLRVQQQPCGPPEGPTPP